MHFTVSVFYFRKKILEQRISHYHHQNHQQQQQLALNDVPQSQIKVHPFFIMHKMKNKVQNPAIKTPRGTPLHHTQHSRKVRVT